MIHDCDDDPTSEVNAELSRLVERGFTPISDEFDGIYGYDRMDKARLEQLQVEVMQTDCSLSGAEVREYENAAPPDLDL